MKSFSRWALVIIVVAALPLPGLVRTSYGQDVYWQKSDIEESLQLIKSVSQVMLTRHTTIFQRPPFYKGKMPLEFEEVCINVSMGMSSSQVAIIRDFGAWRNLFIFKDTRSVLLNLPVGAVSVDNKTNYIIAECKVLRSITNEKRLIGFEILERHYSDDKTLYEGKFRVDYPRGTKIREYDTIGVKQKEYYFLWSSPF